MYVSVRFRLNILFFVSKRSVNQVEKVVVKFFVQVCKKNCLYCNCKFMYINIFNIYFIIENDQFMLIFSVYIWFYVGI